MKPSYIVTSLSTAMLSLATASIAQSVTVSMFGQRCGDSVDVTECANRIESSQLATHHTVAWRSGDTLVVSNQDTVVHMVDHGVVGDHQRVLNRFLGYYESADLSLVFREVDSNATLLLIDGQDMATYEVTGVPILSPDEHHFLVTSDRPDSNAIEIWNSSPPRELWRTVAPGLRSMRVTWLDSESVEVVLVSTSKEGDGMFSPATVRIGRVGDVWGIDPAGAWDAVPGQVMVRDSNP